MSIKMTSETLPFRQPAWYLLLVAVALGFLFGGAAYAVNSSVFKPPPPGTSALNVGDWVPVAFVDAVALAAWVFMLWGPLKQHFTRFTEDGIRQPGPRGP